jgi:hypothetical protein
MYKLISLFICLLVVFLNIWIFFSTRDKIQIYKENPPFPAIDFTLSEKLDPKSKLIHLLDNDPNTYWKKKREVGGWDIDLELRLTHYRTETIYKSRKFSYLELIPCIDSNWDGKVKAFVFFREAINVDKELRLPVEQEIFSGEFIEEENVRKLFLADYPNLQNSELYSKGIYIFGTKLKFIGGKGEACFTRINVKEEDLEKKPE